MSELGDIMGDEFESEYQEKRQQAREEASKVDKEVLMEIAYEAINNGGFKGEEPRFRFSGPNVQHDVLLMESPDRDLQKFRHQLGDDAMTMGMFHLDTLFSIVFQSNMIDMLDKIEEDEYYLVAGRYQEKTQTNGSGEEETYYNINPVRGIVPLSIAKKYADKYEEKMAGSSVEEQSEEQNTESSDDDMDLGGLDDDEGVSDDEIIAVFKEIGSQAEDVLKAVASGEEDMMDKLVNVTNNNLSGEADREHILDVFEDNVDEIEGRGEEEEEEDDGMDLGDLGGDSDDEEESEEDDVTPTDDGGDEEEESADDDEDSDPSDWF